MSKNSPNNDKLCIALQPLTSAAFSAYGEVISCAVQDAAHPDFITINAGQTQRYHDLAHTEVDAAATLGISLFRQLQAAVLPIEIHMLERHPLGSQAFIPMQAQLFIIVVAPAWDDTTPDLSQLQAFISDGTQGVNYRAGTWHHPLLTLEAPSLFAVVDRIGSDPNCDVYPFEDGVWITEGWTDSL